MIIQGADLFSAMSLDAINEIKTSIVEESHDKGSLLFKQDDPAKYFYTLINGRVQLAIGKEGEIDYTISRPGEIFGLSSMVDRECYTANAQCIAPTKIAKIQKDKLEQILEKYPRDATLFFKHLSAAIMKRLIDNYGAFLSQGSLQGVSYGSRQVASESED
ncbi:MAG: cyclic nucleotide-binding domain-containing protein [Pseudomonadota bacterium]